MDTFHKFFQTNDACHHRQSSVKVNADEKTYILRQAMHFQLEGDKLGTSLKEESQRHHRGSF